LANGDQRGGVAVGCCKKSGLKPTAILKTSLREDWDFASKFELIRLIRGRPPAF